MWSFFARWANEAISVTCISFLQGVTSRRFRLFQPDEANPRGWRVMSLATVVGPKVAENAAIHRRSRAGILIGAAVAAAIASLTSPASAQQAKPNVVFILADNVGYGDLGSYAHNLTRFRQG